MSVRFKTCIMTSCRNTSVLMPGELFIRVPNHTSPMRNVWLKACGRNEKNVAPSPVMFVCKDHFDLHNDVENYIRVQLTGCKKILRKDAVPRNLYWCKHEKRLCESAITDQNKRHKIQETNTIATSPIDPLALVKIESDFCDVQLPSTSTCCETVQDKSDAPSKSFGVQVRPYVRSKAIQCTLLTEKECEPEIDRITEVSINTAVCTEVFHIISSTSSESAFSSPVKSSDEYIPTSETSEKDWNEESKPLVQQVQKMSLSVTLSLIEAKPRRYLGIPTYSFYAIDLLHKHTKCTIADIYLVLIKIRTDRTFAELADNFGTSAVRCGRIFSKYLPQIVYYMQQLIHDIPVTQIKYLLPIPFRARYSHVKYIIYYFEIKIEQPEDPVKQALTWSEYKKANTMKYLVSATPDGVINFISTGFGGRTPDSTIIKKSGFLDILHPQSAVMADRGFKQADSLLVERGCTLVRPASYIMGTKLSKDEVIDTKRIASLRIHIKRVIRRLREFKMLRLESQMDSKMIRYLDLCVKCACAIANLQGPLIKQE